MSMNTKIDDVRNDIEGAVNLLSLNPNNLSLLSNILDANGDALDIDIRVKSAITLIASLYFYDDDAQLEITPIISDSIRTICDELEKHYRI
ncbi:hypothetical protein [Paenibacillus taichungensis]